MKLRNKVISKIVSVLLIFGLVYFQGPFITLAEEATPSPSVNPSPSSSPETVVSSSSTPEPTPTPSSSPSESPSSSPSPSSTSTAALVVSPTPTPTVMPWTDWTGEGDWTTRSTNQNTGAESTNSATTTDSSDTTIQNTNTAAIQNDTATTSTTGSNSASQNTGDATITTGDASTTSSTQNIANLNWVGQGDWTNMWNGEALNYVTGYGSTNTATNNFDGVIQVLTENGVNIQNLAANTSTTGQNSALQNTGNATITTGDAAALATIFNLANTNIIGASDVNLLYQDIFGSFQGDIDLSTATPYLLSSLASAPLTVSSSNQTTGADSTNSATQTSNLSLDVQNLNDGILDNNLDLSAVSGQNTASENTGNATITTGDAEIIANIINMLNTNVYTPSFYLGVINVFGEWLGNLILPQMPSGSVAGTAATSSSNSLTGADSVNTASNTDTTQMDIQNQNDGTVGNDLTLAGITGDNSASQNTLSGFIDTGNTTIDADQANWVNTNIVSDSPWWMILINNMGTWTQVLIPTSSLTGVNVVTDLDTLGQSATNTQTGADSTNTATNSNTTGISSSNQNTGQIQNTINANAITGQNSADRNTGFATITTGDASILANTINFLNTNIYTPSFLLTIVNVFGNWQGNVVDAGTSTTGLQVNTTDSQTQNTVQQAFTIQSPSVGGNSPTNTTQNTTNNTSTETEQNQTNSKTGVNLQITSAPSGGLDFSVNNDTVSTPDDGDGEVLSFTENSSTPTTTQSIAAKITNPAYLLSEANLLPFVAGMGLLSLYLKRSQRKMRGGV
jgi:trimeric autotransporter adhesin